MPSDVTNAQNWLNTQWGGLNNLTGPGSQMLGGGITSGPGGLVKGISGGFNTYNPYQAGGAGNLQNPNVFTGTDPNSFTQGITYDTANSGDARNKQMALANALQQQAQGQGVNLGQQQFQNALQQSIQAQAGTIASQRGLNPALATKMATDVAGQQQAGAAGQSALQNMQQQLMAQQQLGGILGEARGQDITQTGTVGGLQNQLALGQGQLENQYQLGRGQLANQYNNANIQNALGQQQINARIAQANTNQANQATSGMLAPLGAIGQILNKGGVVVPHYDEGGSVYAATVGPFSGIQEMLESKKGGSKGGASGTAGAAGDDAGTASLGEGAASALPLAAAARGGMIPGYAGGGLLGTVASLAPLIALAAAQQGGKVGGKAKVHGNSPKNDTVPAMLSPGEIVLPRTVVDGDDSGEKAKAFVEAIKRHTGKSSYGKVLAAKRKAGK